MSDINLVGSNYVCILYSNCPLLKKVLFIASHRKDRAPGQRFRFEQYFDILEKNGFECHLSYLLNEEDDNFFYKPGHYLKKAAILFRNYKTRANDLRHIQEYDLIFLFREALMTGSLFFEKKLAASGKKIIYDFDDAIWMNDTSKANQLFAWMKYPEKIGQSMKLSTAVFAGNSYLADYARQFNPNVIIVPTTIDTSEYKRIESEKKDHITIGWSGSLTTIKHFEFALPFLKKIKNRYGDKVRIKVIGDPNYTNKELDIEGVAWSRSSEVRELSSFDIGIMPLPDDPWAKGKCGLKGLQYMALGIATLMSPVGVNTEIIQDGINGFLPSGEEDWFNAISLLIENEELRKRLGDEARRTVEKRYSKEANAALYLQWFKTLGT
jgi:glycosyltransferase involved in cell wall biosynthesis